MRIYLDAAPVIYWVERRPIFAEHLDERLSAPGDFLVASELTRMECLVLPVREGDYGIIEEYDDFFAMRVVEMVPLTREVVERATQIRARYRFATPDAIHFGAALASGCDVFLTNDNRLSRFLEMTVEVVEDNLE